LSALSVDFGALSVDLKGIFFKQAVGLKNVPEDTEVKAEVKPESITIQLKRNSP
jgi:hypothetical protein